MTNWIKKALPGNSKGKLHKALGVAEDKKIPMKKMDKAEKTASPKVKKEIVLAKTLKKMNKGK